MKAILPKLKYAYNALEPYIDRRTMEIHHTKHHQAYINNFNQAVSGLNINFKSAGEVLKNLDKIPKNIKQAVINNGGGHVNHAFFWKIMSPAKTKPEGKMIEMLNSKFGSLENFKQKFSEKALSLFGSGWVFLVSDKKGNIKLKRHSFQNSPLTEGNIPIIGIDLWEHAYYLKYQNKRIDYIEAWWNLVNWKEAEKNLLRPNK
jgi:superoxide dismutase, Fe-Mn family